MTGRHGEPPPRTVAELAALDVPAGFDDETPIVRQAAALAAHAHRGQTDKVGVDYFNGHLRDVYRRAVAYGADEVERAAALLHDTDEDTHTRLHDLQALGLPDALLLIVHLMTRRPEQPDDLYYALLRAHPPALRVKRDADIASNADPVRLQRIPDPAVRERLTDKYASALRTLAAEGAR